MNDTRDFIVERAFCLFLQRGYEGISIRDIQEAVELSKGAIYHYFRSKEEIFGEAMDRYLLPAIQTLPEALESESAFSGCSSRWASTTAISTISWWLGWPPSGNVGGEP